MPASRPPLPADTSPAPPPSSSSPPTLPAEQCITPPSVRRREARIARCAIAARNARRGGDGEAEAQAGGDGDSRVRTGYAAEEVEARRAGRREAERQGWRGWEVEADAYGGQRWGEDEGGVVRADGTVDWARLDAAAAAAAATAVDEVAPPHDAIVPITTTTAAAAADPLFLRESFDTQPATLPPTTIPTTTLGFDSLPSNALPLLLSALYVAARALGVGSPTHRRTRTRSASQSGVGEKVRMGPFERQSRE